MGHHTTQARDSFSLRDSQRALPLVLLVSVAVVGFYWSTSVWLAGEWNSSNALFEHGYLILLVSAVLLLSAAGRIPPEPLQPSRLALAAVVALSLGWLLARVASVAVVQTLALPALLLGALVAIFGYAAGRVFAPAVLYFSFALPFWEVLKVPLRDLTIIVVEAFLRLGGVPAVIEGSLVHIPAGTFRIASGCSGLNFFVVGLALAALYGYVFYTSNLKRILLLGVGMAIAMLANWIRVAAVIAVGNSSDMQSRLVDDHQTFGWLIFVVALLPFFGIAMWLGRKEPHGERLATRNWAGPRLQRRNLAAALAVLAALAVGPVWAKLTMDGYPADARARVNLPLAIDGWRGPVRTGSSWRPHYEGVSGEVTARYESEDGLVWMYANVYLSQDQGRELIYIHNRIGGDANVLNTTTTRLTGSSGETFSARVMDVDDGLRSRRIVYWYEIGGRRVASDLRAKLHQAKAVLTGQPEAGVVAVSAACDFECSAADERIARFVAALGDDYRLDYTLKGIDLR